MTNFKPIDDNTPKDRRILVKTDIGTVYAAYWVQDIYTGHEAWLIACLPDGSNALIESAISWCDIPD